MKPPRIYSDFSGLRESICNSEYLALSLHCWGSLVDLHRLHIELYEGLQLTVYSDSDINEDVEATGSVYFDVERNEWFVEFDESSIRYVVTVTDSYQTKLICWHCQTSLKKQTAEKGLKLGDTCNNCGKEIHELLKPPNSKAESKNYVPPN